MDLITVVLVLIFVLSTAIAFWIGSRVGAFRKHREWELDLPSYRKDAVARSRAVLGGNFSENLAPYLPDFPYFPTECKFMGKPVDFICFKGMDNKKIDEVVFVEVKSGKAKLNSQEKNLKEAIEKGKVSYEEYRIPEDVTKGGLEED